MTAGPDGDRPRPLTLLVIAKEPVPGRVKTRLTPPCTPAQAARLAEAALADTLATLSQVTARRVLVLDGAPGSWLPPGWTVTPQRGGGLDERLAAAFESCPAGPAVLVGMDTPQLGSAQLRPVLAPWAWHRRDAWFGPAYDGGFWCLGLADPTGHGALVRGVPMSRPDTGALQLARLRAAGLGVGLLPRLRDVDTAADAAAVAAEAPDGRFAAELARMQGVPAVSR